MSKLSNKMNDDMILHGFSFNTRKSYITSIRRLAKYYNRSPDQISNDEIQQYLLHPCCLNERCCRRRKKVLSRCLRIGVAFE
ncbi:phage integrase N-terminal SAM-like domain-containing protein, partial [Legionella pneumophila]